MLEQTTTVKSSSTKSVLVLEQCCECKLFQEEKFAKAKELAKFLWTSDYHQKVEINKREKKLRSEYERLRQSVQAAHVVLKGANDAGVVARQTHLIRQEIKSIEVG